MVKVTGGPPSVTDPLRECDTADEALASQLSAGDAGAFDALVRRHHKRVRSVCYRMTGSPHEADDLTQETFLRVFRHRDSYQPGRPFRVWLHRICVNVCLTHCQSQRRHGALVSLADSDRMEPLEPTPAARAADPEAQAGHNELVRSVHNALQDLAPGFRSALVLRLFGELSYLEIANALGCSIGTVMSRINRARLKIRDALGERPC